MASLDFLSCNAPAGMMLQLLHMLGTCATSKGVEIPQDISLMLTLSAINSLTITLIRVRLSGDEEEGD